MRWSLFCAPLAFLLPLFANPSPAPVSGDRSPVDLVLTPDEKFLISANQTSGTVSLVHLESGQIRDEISCGKHLTALTLSADGRDLFVSATFSSTVTWLRLEGDRLQMLATIPVRFEPRGLTLAPDRKHLYVAQTTANAVAVVDLDKKQIVDSIPVGQWPRYLALSDDGKKLAVGINGDGGIAVVDPIERKVLYREEFTGLNLGQMQISKDQKHVYFPWIVYRHNPITTTNIKLGWILASRIARVKLDGPARREAFSLDPPGQAIADPHGLALSPDEKNMVCSASGSQELLVYRLAGLPFQDYGGTDHIDADLLKDKERFFRVPLGGRPMALRYSRDGKRVFVANYLLNAIQVVEPAQKKIVQTIDLGGSATPTLSRRGEAIFFDGKRSLDQWYSCHSCHYEGHTNAVTMDTKNDGRFGNFKTVLSLRNVTRTGPWFWHGWAKDLPEALERSFTDTMLGKTPTKDDVDALYAYLDTLETPPNPHRGPQGELSEAAQRGEKVFQSEKAGCARCHTGKYFTDARVHDVGTNDRTDAFKGYNPPSLLGIYDRTRFLHEGKTKSLEEVLRGPHSPARVTAQGDLSETELQDLLAYLRSL